MFPIDDPTAATTLPTPEAAGTPGFWTEGNPTLGVPATRVRASFLNMLMQELLNILVAAGITPSKTTYNQIAQAIPILTPGRQIGHRVFTSSTTYTPTPGTAFVEIEVVGAGAAGGGVPTTTAGQVAVGAGGTSGARAIGRFAVAAVTGQTITVGAAGVGALNATGGNGGASSVGSLIVANGGTGGSAGTASGSSIALGNTTQAAATGGNIFNETGRIARLAVVVFGSLAYGGDGGDSAHGAGGSGFASPLGTLSGNGLAATGYGAGGGGALATTSNASTRSGGNASPGVVVIKEFA
ncbi:hypothetical protein [Variovorax sp. N23]|uniref:glycine-rich domain-containing protein n=1 Tax=Variovorax sp. N23 TaxID=2980555 RepID=UPI0021C6E556|nr:hypothetical protein [Variovorax sp. N23]MCU4119287.1 hypothetical protein [Variovorax sp. N23]